MRRSFLSVFTILTLLIIGNRVCFAQTNPANSPSKKEIQTAAKEKLRKKVEKIGIGGKITVIRLDEKDFYGKITAIEADGFQIDDVDSAQTIDFKYAELKKVKKGDGERNLLTGKRNNPSAKRGLLYGALIFGTLFVLLGIGLSDKDF